MQTVPKDVTIEMMLELDLGSIINLCKTSSKFNVICQSPLFWKRKLQKDYPNINIENVTEYKNLYLYLKKKPSFKDSTKQNLDSRTQWGDLSSKGNKIFGSGGNYYSINKIGELIKSGISFPKFPPEYFSNFGTDIFVLNYMRLIEIRENLIGNKSFVTGPFGERYTVILRDDNIDRRFFDAIIKGWNSLDSAGRFINGIIYKDLVDTFENKIYKSL